MLKVNFAFTLQCIYLLTVTVSIEDFVELECKVKERIHSFTTQSFQCI